LKFSEKDRAPIPETRHEDPELMPRVSHRDRLRVLRKSVPGKEGRGFRLEDRGIKAEVLSEPRVEDDESRIRDRGGDDVRIKPARERGIGMSEAQSHSYTVALSTRLRFSDLFAPFLAAGHSRDFQPDYPRVRIRADRVRDCATLKAYLDRKQQSPAGLLRDSPVLSCARRLQRPSSPQVLDQFVANRIKQLPYGLVYEICGLCSRSALTRRMSAVRSRQHPPK
jgi:hypothetical protein